jgi:hypothetical protein
MSLADRLSDLLRDKHIGLTTVIVTINAIAADARFNIWFLDNVKSQASESVAIAKVYEYGDLRDACMATIQKFDRDHSVAELETALETYAKTSLKL